MSPLLSEYMVPRHQEPRKLEDYFSSVDSSYNTTGIKSPQQRYLERLMQNRRAPRAGFVKSLTQGTVKSVLEPFQIVGVDVPDYSDVQRTGMGTLGYYIGYLAGFMVPGSAAYKFAGKGLTTTARLLGRVEKASEAAELIGRAGQLASRVKNRDKVAGEILQHFGWKEEAILGSAAGALLGAGMSDPKENLGVNVLTGAVLGAVGDPVGSAVFRAAGSFWGAKVSPKLPEVIKKVSRGRPISSVQEADLLGRASKEAEIKFLSSDIKDADERYGHVVSMLHKAGFGNMNSLEARIIPSVDKTGKDLKAIFSKMSDVLDWDVVEYTANGVKKFDYVVGMRGHLDDRLVKHLKETAKDGTPWFPGQRVRYRGKAWSVNKKVMKNYRGAQREYFELSSPSAFSKEGKRKTSTVLVSSTIPESGIVQFSLGPKSLRNPLKFWKKWLDQHSGAFPEGDFNEAFDEFVDELTGKGQPLYMKWSRRDGAGAHEQVGHYETRVKSEVFEKILPRKLRAGPKPLTKEAQESYDFLFNAVSNREVVASPKLTVDIINTKTGPAMKVVDVDGVKRAEVARVATGEESIPLQIELRKGTEEQMAAAMKANRFYNPGNRKPFAPEKMEVPKIGREYEALNGEQIQVLKEFFGEQIVRELRLVDPELDAVLKNFAGLKHVPREEGAVSVMAAQNGYLVDQIYDSQQDQWVWRIKDVLALGDTPGAELTFETEDYLRAFLRENPRELPDLTYGVNIPEGAFSSESTGFVPRHSAMSGTLPIDQAKVPHFYKLIRPILPQESYLRFMNDIVIEKTGVDMGIVEAHHKLIQGLNANKKAIERGLRPDAPIGHRLSMQDLIDIRSSTIFGKSNVRFEKMESVTALMELPMKQWDEAAKRLDLNDKEVKVAQQLRQFFNEIFDFAVGHDLIDITGKDFIEDYWPHIRRRPAGTQQEGWVKSVQERLDKKYGKGKKKVSNVAIKFIHEMKRTGNDPLYQRDPFLVPMQYLRAISAKIHLKEPYEVASQVANKVVDLGKKIEKTNPTNTDISQIGALFQGYIETTRGQNPEAFVAARQFMSSFFESMGVKLPEKAFDQVVNTLMSLNYGAFMGFRPGQAIRNLTQTVAVTLPTLQNPKHLIIGFMRALTKEGWEEADKAGAILASHGTPLEDMEYTGRLYRELMGSGKKRGKVAGTAIRTVRGATELAELSLGSRKLRIGKLEIPIGFFGTSDEFNRVVSYHAFKSKVSGPMNSLRRGEITFDEFAKKAGLRFMGASHEKAVERMINAGDWRKAIEYVGVRGSHETQWIYQRGSGPAMFNHAVGRLFGQYGTWPSWMAAAGIRATRAFKNDPVSAAKAAAWFGAVTAGLNYATQTSGLDWRKWGPFSGLLFSGGVAMDYAKDATDVMSGYKARTAKYQLALSKYGLGSDIDLGKFYDNTLGVLTPGWLALKDAKEAAELAGDGEIFKGAVRGLLAVSPMVTGGNAPQIQISY